jgi:hypothetical protein
MKRMKLIPAVLLFGLLVHGAPGMAQAPEANPAAAPPPALPSAPAVPYAPGRLPVLNLKTKGEWPMEQIVQQVRESIAKANSSAPSINILMGPGVAELPAPADLDLKNISPVGLFEAIASVEPRLSHRVIRSSPSEVVITLHLGPQNPSGATTGQEIKLRAFRLPELPIERREANEAERRSMREVQQKKSYEEIVGLMERASELLQSAGGLGTTKRMKWSIHQESRTVLVAGTQDDLELAEEVLSALGGTRKHGPRTAEVQTPIDPLSTMDPVLMKRYGLIPTQAPRPVEANPASPRKEF